MITKMQNSVFSKLVSVFLIVTMLLYTNQNLFAQSSTQITDKKELFRALFFLDSPLLNNLPNLKVFKIDGILENNEELSKYIEHENDVINRIQKSDPTFFETFAKEITSGNQLRIKSAMNLGALKMEAAYKESIAAKLKSVEYTKTSANFLNYLKQNNVPAETYTQKAEAVRSYLSYLRTDQTQSLASVTIVLAAAAVALLVVVVTVAVAVDGLFWDGTPTGLMGKGNSLINDEIINEIAVNFNGIL